MCERMHVTLCVCANMSGRCVPVPVYARLCHVHVCTTVGQHGCVSVCTIPGPVANLELRPGRLPPQDTSSPQLKAQRKVLLQVPLQEDLNLPKLLEAALETVAWAPGGERGGSVNLPSISKSQLHSSPAPHTGSVPLLYELRFLM